MRESYDWEALATEMARLPPAEPVYYVNPRTFVALVVVTVMLMILKIASWA